MLWVGFEDKENEWGIYKSEAHRLIPITIVHNCNIDPKRLIVAVVFRDIQTSKITYDSSNSFLECGSGGKFYICNVTNNSFSLVFLLSSQKELEYQVCVTHEPDDPVVTATTGDAEDSLGFPVTYRFDWGDSSLSSWLEVPIATHTYNHPGIYKVRAQASASNSVSDWSPPTLVRISKDPIYVYTPGPPKGPSEVKVGEKVMYEVTPVQGVGEKIYYRMNFGDGYISKFSTALTFTYAWKKEGIYQIKAQAKTHYGEEYLSLWSNPKTVKVVSAITTVPVINVSSSTQSSEGQSPKPIGSGPYATVMRPFEITVPEYYAPPGHEVQYRVDFGDALRSLWSKNRTFTHSWFSTGIYNVSAQVRIRNLLSSDSAWTELDWSYPLQVRVISRYIKPPRKPDCTPEAQCRIQGTKTKNPNGLLFSYGTDFKWVGEWTYTPQPGTYEIEHGLKKIPYFAWLEFDLEGSEFDRYGEVSSQIISKGNERGEQAGRILFNHGITLDRIFIQIYKCRVSFFEENKTTIERIVSKYRLIVRGT